WLYARVHQRQGQIGSKRCRFDTGIRAGQVQQLAVEDATAALIVGVLLHIQIERRHVVRVVARICAACRVDAACGEAGANQKKKGDSDLCDDEGGAELASGRAARRRVLVDDRYEIDPGTL